MLTDMGIYPLSKYITYYNRTHNRKTRTHSGNCTHSKCIVITVYSSRKLVGGCSIYNNNIHKFNSFYNSKLYFS